MSGDTGPYMEPDGPLVWVPRTVPYLEARRLAAQANENDDRLVYRGKCDAELLGFAVDCSCDEVCERHWRYNEDTGDEETEDRTCVVPAWKFELVER